MAMSVAEVHAVAAELDARLRGARVRKVHEPAEHEVVLTLGGAGGEATTRLLVSTHRRHPRVHPLAAPRANPPEPSPFCMTLRRHLEGARLTAVRAAPGDRVVRLELTRGEATATLVAELFPGRGAVVLLDADGRVLAARPGSLAGRRTATAGEPYPPPIPPHAPEPPRSEPPRSEPPRPEPAGCVERIAAREEAAERAEELETVRGRAAADLAHARRRAERLIAKLEREEGARIDPALGRLDGEALKAALDRVPRGAESVRLTGWTADGPRDVDVPLDPRKSPRENMERWFQRARKAERATEHVARRIAETRERLAELRVREEAVAAATSIDELPVPAQRTRRHQAKRRDALAVGPPRYRSHDGYVILVGRSAAENDEITFRIAAGRDVWLHVRGRPGSHVVIRVPDAGRPPPLETLLDAALLAVHHSPARGSTKVEVSYTARKNVRKPRRAPAGLVTISGEKTLLVDPDPARLRRLADTRRNDPAVTGG